MIANDAGQAKKKVSTSWWSPSLMMISFVALFGLLTFGASAQTPRSHTRFVRVEEAKVYCGPSESLYTTSVLKKGDAVEIFHITDDGWAGIRPPESSFDWLEAEHAYLLPGGRSAEVVGKPIPCWIGSSLDSPAKYRWQIELQPTQQVRVIGEARQVIDNGTERLWYKIAPPPGEFRWVRLVDLDKQPIANSDTANIRSGSGRREQDPKHVDAPTDEVTRAQFLTDGEWIVDETIADETLPSPKSVRPGQPNEIVLGEDSYEVDGPYEVEDSLNECCDECGVAPCCCHRCFLSRLGLPCGCQTHPNEGMVVQRLNGILGLVGFGVARLPVDPTPVEPGVFRANLEPVPSRLDHLPRPGGRTRMRQLRSPLNRGLDLFSTNATPADDSSWKSRLLVASGSSEVGTGLDHTQPRNGRVPDFTLFAASLGALSANSDNPEGSWHGVPSQPACGIGNQPGTATQQLRDVPRTIPIDRTESVVPAAHWTTGTLSSSFQVPSEDAATLELTTPSLQRGLIQLSMIVSKPVELWDTSQIKELALRSIEHGATAVERGEARLLLERVEQFESLRMRSIGLPVPSSTTTLATNTASRSGMVSDGDASGWLVQVHKTLPNQPEFALTDLAGNVVAYVDPAPGVNLRRFNHEAVIVYGARGYLPALSAKHITAERVVRIR